MTQQKSSDSCRKCGARNPQTNAYCASCGAILKITTGMIEAQRTPDVPVEHRFEKRWLLIAVFVVLGAWALSLALFSVFSYFVFHVAATDLSFSENGLGNSLIPMALLAIAVAGGVLFFAGVTMSRLAGDNKMRETVLAALLVSIVTGVAGSALSSDFLLASILIGLPGTIAAGFGARFGKKAE